MGGPGNPAVKELADSIPDAYFALDHDLRYTCWNRAAERLTGIPADVAIGKKIVELFRDSRERGAVLRLCREVLEKRTPKTIVTSHGLGGRKGLYEIYAHPSSAGLSVFVRDVSERQRGEVALRRSEARHRALFHDTLEAMCVTHHGRIVDVNKAWLGLHGYSDRDEVIGKDIIEFVADEDKEQLRTRRGKTFEDGKIRAHEIRDRRRDGSPVLVEVQSSTLYEGSDPLVLSIVRDITERKAIERRLLASEEKFRTMMEHTYDWEYWIGLDQQILYMTQSCQRIVGYEPDEFYREPGLVERLVHPEDAKAFRDHCASHCSMDMPDYAVSEVTFRIITKGGDERWIEHLCRPVFGEDAAFLGYRVSNRDVTRRRKAELALESSQAALMRSEADYRALAQNLPGIVYRLSLGDPPAAQFFNDQLIHVTGYTWDELRPGRLCLLESLIAEEDRAAVLAEIQKAVTAHEAFRVEYRIRRKDGTLRYVTGRGNPIYDEAGHPVAIDGLLFDSTEQRLLQDAAREHQERTAQASRMIALGTLVSGVAHEINNPNNFITLNLPLLKTFNEGLKPIIDEYYREHGDFPVGGLLYSEVRESIPKLLAGIEEGARRIRIIVKELRDFARPGSPAHDQPVDMGTIVRSAVNLLWNSIQKSTTHFVEQHEERLPKVMGNAQRLEQVVINLIQNACDALTSREQGITIRTTSDRQARTVMVVVRDEGAGMKAEDLERLGRPFFTTKRDRGGMGLGVSISQRILKEHNGELRYSSELGRGTVATLILSALPETPLTDRQP
ncbi:MAG: PAS domain S-box protein [Acidobacteriota bacterium]